MSRLLRHICPLLLLFLLVCGLFVAETSAQGRLDFSIFANGLEVRSAGSGTDVLNFNDKVSPIVLGSDPITIDLTDDTGILAILEIEAARGFDIDVVVNPPPGDVLRLDGTGSETIPYELRWAFANSPGMSTIDDARTQAIEVYMPAATFPIQRRSFSGPPGPPPAPRDGNMPEFETEIAYLFFFGTFGPVPTDIQVGEYSGLIEVHVSYTNNHYPEN